MAKGTDHIELNKFPPSALAVMFVPRGMKIFSAKGFLLSSFIALLILVSASVIVHIGIDIYGLFRPVKGRQIQAYHDERIAKYLLMHRYVPENYNGVLIGTSLSDNLDITAYNQSQRSFRFYNASMMGANISEVKTVTEKAIAGGVNNIVFCVSPYQFKNSGAKEVELDDKLYYGALGSWNLYETYAVALMRETELLPSKFPKEHISADGVNNFISRYRASDVAERIRQVADVHRGKDFIIDEEAMTEFRNLVAIFKQKNIRFMVYFHPVPSPLYDVQRDAYTKFERMVREIVGDEKKILDLNQKDWQEFTTDFNNYIDNGHLSEQGQEKVTFSVMKAFEYLYP